MTFGELFSLSFSYLQNGINNSVNLINLLQG